MRDGLVCRSVNKRNVAPKVRPHLQSSTVIMALPELAQTLPKLKSRAAPQKTYAQPRTGESRGKAASRESGMSMTRTLSQAEVLPRSFSQTEPANGLFDTDARAKEVVDKLFAGSNAANAAASTAAVTSVDVSRAATVPLSTQKLRIFASAPSLGVNASPISHSPKNFRDRDEELASEIQQHHSTWTLKRRKWDFLQSLAEATAQATKNHDDRTIATLTEKLQTKHEREQVEDFVSLQALRVAKHAHLVKQEWLKMEKDALAHSRARERTAMGKYRHAAQQFTKAKKAPHAFKGKLEESRNGIEASISQVSDAVDSRANTYNVKKSPIPYELLIPSRYQSKFRVRDANFQAEQENSRKQFFDPDELISKSHMTLDTRALQLRNTETKKERLDNLKLRLKLIQHLPEHEANPIICEVEPPSVQDLTKEAPFPKPAKTPPEEKKKHKAHHADGFDGGTDGDGHAKPAEIQRVGTRVGNDASSALATPPLTPPPDSSRGSPIQALLKKARDLKELNMCSEPPAELKKNGKPKYRAFRASDKNTSCPTFDSSELQVQRNFISAELQRTDAALMRLNVHRLQEMATPMHLDELELSPRSKDFQARRDLLRSREPDHAANVWLKKHDKPIHRKVDPSERTRCQTLFDQLDLDGSGTLEFDEIGEAIRDTGLEVTLTELKQIWSVIANNAQKKHVQVQEFSAEFHGDAEYETLLKIFKERQSKADDNPVLPMKLWVPAYHRHRTLEDTVEKHLEREQAGQSAGGHRMVRLEIGGDAPSAAVACYVNAEALTSADKYDTAVVFSLPPPPKIQHGMNRLYADGRVRPVIARRSSGVFSSIQVPPTEDKSQKPRGSLINLHDRDTLRSLLHTTLQVEETTPETLSEDDEAEPAAAGAQRERAESEG